MNPATATAEPEAYQDRVITLKHAQVIDLGELNYGDVWFYQKYLHLKRVVDEIPDTLVFVEHSPVITRGRAARSHENLKVSRDDLKQRGVEFFEVERGGDVTFHGPGQLVGYPIFKLGGLREVVPTVRKTEAALIRALRYLGIEARVNPPYTGVWVGDDKIAAIGMAVRNHVTFHGFALNVSTNLSYFDLIVPCGIEGNNVTSIDKLIGHTPMSLVKDKVARGFSKVFGMRLEKFGDWQPQLLLSQMVRAAVEG
ncbi:MAG: lipoyl(octanoyl) transferase LipB [bacterium]